MEKITKIDQIKGLYFFENLIDHNECIKLVQDIDNDKENDWFTKYNKFREHDNGTRNNDNNSRMVKQFGYYFNYDSHDIYEKAPDFPSYLYAINKIITQKCIDEKIFGENKYCFNQCIINNYYPGQGIMPHADKKDFGPIIACLTIGSGANMKFSYYDSEFKLYTTAGSLYVMTDESRYKWRHSMEIQDYDIVNGEKINRDRRISLTFRYVPDININSSIDKTDEQLA